MATEEDDGVQRRRGREVKSGCFLWLDGLEAVVEARFVLVECRKSKGGGCGIISVLCSILVENVIHG